MRSRQKALDAVLPFLIGGGVALAAFDLGRRLFRHRHIFCPDPNPTISWDPADYGVPEGAVEEHWIDTPDGEVLHAWYCRAENPKASGVYCHGNTGNLTWSAHSIPHLLAAGFNVLFFDYRGFGKSTGLPTYRGVIADGITAARFHDRLRPKHLPSVLYGFSLGGGIAAQVIRRHSFDGLVLHSTFTNLPQITRIFFPRLPLHLFAGDLFNTVDVVRKLQVPLLLMHGTEDEVIPCWMSHELFGACMTEKRIQLVEGGLHKDLYDREPDTLVWTLSQFIADLPRNPRSCSVEETPAIEQWTDSALRALRRRIRGQSAEGRA